MRLIRVSLAWKYRLLFGVAVLLIIGAALYLPWRLVESLVQEQPFREALRVAENYFRLTLGATHPGAGGMHADQSILNLSGSYRAPQFIRNTANPDDPSSLLALREQMEYPEFVAGAMKKFMLHPARNQIYQTQEAPGGTRFVLARAVRASKSCIDCHMQGQERVRPFHENQLTGVIVVDLPFDQSGEQLWFSRLAMVAAALLAGILAILLFYVIVQKFILSPIDELREVALRVTAGDIAVRSTVETGDEFQQLSDNLNTMLERLRNSQEELRRANRLLDEKLGEMAQTNVALYESNRVKGEFLANVTHELRTPLTSIIGFAELLREGPVSEPSSKSARYAENILISGRILLEIINDLLDLAKIEAGKVELKLEPVRVEEVCSTLVDFTRPLADKKGIVLNTEWSEGLPILITDRGRFRQVLFNLLSNAIKFTPDGGQVTLAARREGTSDAHIEVRDTGPGIARENQSLIFDKFRQIDGSATREHHGTGLGLAIAMELTTLLGGKIGVVSELGQGATFWITLPSATPDPPPRIPVSLT